MNKIPFQYKHGVEEFMERVMEKLAEREDIDLSECNLICTGHSLGASHASLATLLALAKYSTQLKSIQSVTMENPGSKDLLLLLANNLKKHGALPADFDLDKVTEHFLIINNDPNVVNTMGEQFGIILHNIVRQYATSEVPYSKYMPKALHDLVDKLLNHIEWHDNGYFARIHTMEIKKEWPVGMFVELVKEQGVNIYDAIMPVVRRSPTAELVFKKVITAAYVVASKSAVIVDKVADLTIAVVDTCCTISKGMDLVGEGSDDEEEFIATYALAI
jgi:hypothetical protein